VTPPALVAGIGSEWRCDDGVGAVVVERVADRCRRLGLETAVAAAVVPEPLGLLGRWDRTELTVVVDATRSGVAPGTVSRLELGPSRAARPSVPSSHGLGLADVLRLARSVGRAPARTVVVGVEGERFTAGSELSLAVASAVEEAVAVVMELLEEVVTCA
jgi:hydrogenase maturation protease